MAKVTVHHDTTGETPSQSIVKAANKVDSITDGRGRAIGIKRLGPIDRLRLFEVVGPENSKNEQYVGYAALAFLVVSIDGETIPRPVNKTQLEALVQRLDDDGMEAVAGHLESEAKAATALSAAEEKAALKNL